MSLLVLGAVLLTALGVALYVNYYQRPSADFFGPQPYQTFPPATTLPTPPPTGTPTPTSTPNGFPTPTPSIIINHIPYQPSAILYITGKQPSLCLGVQLPGPYCGEARMGEDIPVDFKVDSVYPPINSVYETLTFTNLDYVSYSISGSNFPTVSAGPSGDSNGLIFLVSNRNFWEGKAGQVIHMVFRAKATGTATITIDKNNSAVGTDQSNIAPLQTLGARFTISAALPTPTPTPGQGGGSASSSSNASSSSSNTTSSGTAAVGSSSNTSSDQSTSSDTSGVADTSNSNDSTSDTSSTDNPAASLDNTSASPEPSTSSSGFSLLAWLKNIPWGKIGWWLVGFVVLILLLLLLAWRRRQRDEALAEEFMAQQGSIDLPPQSFVESEPISPIATGVPPANPYPPTGYQNVQQVPVQPDNQQTSPPANQV